MHHAKHSKAQPALSKHRVAIEERYAAELQKLARKAQVMDLGTFAPVWEQVQSATGETGDLHGQYAKELSETMDRSLRTRSDNEDFKWLKQNESGLLKSARDFDDKLAKYHKADAKAKKKGSASDKLDKKTADAHAAMEAAKGQWVPEAMQTFERFETMERQRLAFLKETIVKYASVDAKHGTQRSAICDGVMASALEFDVAGEIESFCSSKGNLAGGPPNYAADGSPAPSAAGTPRQGSISVPHENGTTPVTATPSKAATGRLVDEDGYTIPPPQANPPWGAEQGAASLNEDDEEGADALSTAPSSKFKVDIKKEAIVENPNDAISTMKQLAATLQGAPSMRRKATRRMSETQSHTSAEGSVDTDQAQTQRRMTVNPSAFAGADDFFASLAPPTSTPSQPAKFAAPPSPLAFDESSPPLAIRASITETVNVLIKGGAVDKVLVTGEVALSAHPSPLETHRRGIARISLSDPGLLGRTVPNEALARAVDPSRPREFAIDLDVLARSSGTALPVLKYQVNVDPADPDPFTPLFVTPLWKCEPTQTSLLVAYQPNDAMRSRLSLTNVSLLVTLQGGGEIGNVQMKPLGAWNAERKAILWKLGDVDLSKSGGGAGEGTPEAQKLLARLDTNEPCQKGTVAVRFTSSGALLSGIDLMVVDEGTGGTKARLDGVSKVVVSGKYGATEA
ncbi:hypothetical protein HK104_009078 [Borealophlyctis nickersoniae]|nr:hypothetical protein HK104_009078 [Borealophlyctis nickersoniae]